MSTDIRVTTELLYKGALVFAPADAVYVLLLARCLNNETFHKLKWPLVIAAALAVAGALGSLTHLWAAFRGIVTKPPMLQGASPLAAVVIAFFEYVFYWCNILVLARGIAWMQGRLQARR